MQAIASQLGIRDAFPLRIRFRRWVLVNEERLTVTAGSDGDGKMEIVVGSNYYEGEEITIYRCDPNKVEALLSGSCDA
jgi:hypothetical protein